MDRYPARLLICGRQQLLDARTNREGQWASALVYGTNQHESQDRSNSLLAESRLTRDTPQPGWPLPGGAVAWHASLVHAGELRRTMSQRPARNASVKTR